MSHTIIDRYLTRPLNLVVTNKYWVDFLRKSASTQLLYTETGDPSITVLVVLVVLN
jgi:hypothetical protein